MADQKISAGPDSLGPRNRRDWLAMIPVLTPRKAWAVPPVGTGSSGTGTASVRTPTNSGFAVDKNGSGDNTNALNQFFALCASQGDRGFIEPGLYRTTAELLVPPGHAGIFGSGWRKTVIRPHSNTYHGVRMLGSWDFADHGMEIGGLGIISMDTANPPPRNGKAGFILDRCPQALVENMLVDNFDIGFDSINNSYNSTWKHLRTNRSYTNVNCGINIRAGDHSGSDWNLYDTQVSGWQTGICIAGSGGGYRFFGFSVGTNGMRNSDKFGCITIGYDYASDAIRGGLGSMMFDGGHIEGWQNTYAFRGYGTADWSVRGVGFVPSSRQNGTLARGIYKHTNAGGSSTSWISNTCGAGYFQYDQVCYIENAGGGFLMNEQNWVSGSRNHSSGQLFGAWLQSLMQWSNLGGTNQQRGFWLADNPNTWQTMMGFGKIWLTHDNATGTIRKSLNQGATWTAL
jgi:hypothetical protein